MIEYFDTNQFKRRASVSVLAFGTLAVMLSGCGKTADGPDPTGRAMVETCPATTDPGYYFPASTIDPSGDNDGFVRNWFSSHLRSAQLAPLWCGTGNNEVYRLLYLPTSRPAIVIELEESGKDWLRNRRWNVRAFRFDDPRTVPTHSERRDVAIVDRRQQRLSESEAAGFFDSLARASFWHAPDWQDPDVQDGTAILIEGRKSSTYRPVTRFSMDTPMFSAARALMRIAKVPIPPELEDLIYRLEKREGATH
jgi:hypothetical protein